MNEPIDDWQEDGSGTLDVPAPVVAAAVIPAEAPPIAVAPPVAPITEPDADTGTLEDHEAAEEQRREGRDDKGRFRRDRASSQKASPADVPLISDYTRRIKAAEAAAGADIAQQPGESNRVYELRRRAELAERRNTAASDTAKPAATSQAAPSASVARPALAPPPPFYPVKDGKDDPEPDPNQYSDLLKWQRDFSLWGGRESIRQANAASEQARQQYAVQSEIQQKEHAWTDRVSAAQAKLPTVDAKALGALIPPNTLLDAWIINADPNISAAMLVYAHTHQDEVKKLLALPDMMAQNRAMLLMEQKATAPAPKATAQPVAPPPRTIRTTPPVAAVTVPGDEDSLEDHERTYYQERRRPR